MKVLNQLFAIFIFLNASSQNFVLNGGFELNAGCPDFTSQFSLVINWQNPSAGTPDYYNECDNGIFADIPVNAFGYQMAQGGRGYAGLHPYYTGTPDYREYIQAELSSPLAAGANYYFQMYINVGNETQFLTNSIGAYFSTTAVSVGNYYVLPFIPQVTMPAGVFPDTLTWTLVSGIYTATGGERYIIIGNFKDDANTNILPFNPGGTFPNAYLYIDDVCVSPISGGCGVGPVPVNLISLAAIQKDNMNVISWSATSEINNAYFDIERSADTREFKIIGRVLGVYNSQQTNKYSLIDKEPFAGMNYYRLKITDKDGRFSYSKITGVKSIGKDDYLVLFNGATSELSLSSAAGSFEKIEILDATGKIVYKKSVLPQEAKISCAGFTNGLYFVRALNGKQVLTGSFVKY